MNDEQDNAEQDAYAIRDFVNSDESETIVHSNVLGYKIKLTTGPCKCVVKDEFKEEVENNPQNYRWIDGHPLPLKEGTNLHFKLIDPITGEDIK